MPGSPPPASIAPVVVTFREVERILTSPEATGQVQEAANVDPDATPIERAAAMAAMGHVLNALRGAEDQAGARVLTTPQHGAASRLQSLIASGERASLRFDPLPSGGLEAKFDTRDWGGWATVAWAKLKNLKPHPMVRPMTTTPEPLPDRGRVAIVGDWGTGLYGAPEIASAIRRDPDPFGLLLHLGDVYYSGTNREMAARFLDVWPYRAEAVSRGLNSNHDMYSGGDAFFGHVLPRFGQASGYFAMQNQRFTLIGLDVAYKDHDIDDEQVAWVADVIGNAGGRKVIFFSHHQLYSHFESQGKKLWSHPAFGAILRSKRVFAWYWGHEHKCTIFRAPDPQFGLLARCIGHGGMPEPREKLSGLPRTTGAEFSRAEWRTSAAVTKEGNLLPECVVLDGPNPHITGEEHKFAPHGYAVLTFDGPTLKEEVRDVTGAVIYERIIAP